MSTIFFNSKTEKWSWLSCFHPCPIVDNKNAIWPSAEHAFQAQKTKDQKWRNAIRTAENPSRAKRLGGVCPLRRDWEHRKLDLMTKIQRAKFMGNDDLMTLLLQTEHHRLVHKAPWDGYWGDGRDGQGENRLGEILMLLRDEFRRERSLAWINKLEEDESEDDMPG